MIKLIERIKNIIQTDGDDMSDGQVVDAIVNELEYYEDVYYRGYKDGEKYTKGFTPSPTIVSPSVPHCANAVTQSIYN